MGGRGASSSGLSESDQDITSLSSQISETRARLNPIVLVEQFVAGVNSAGGVWTASRGKPSADLGAALDPHARRTTARGESPVEICRGLGARWFAFCAGAPRDAWKAAAWLGEGAPEKAGAPAPSDAQALHQRREAAKLRERDQERLKLAQAAVPATAEARAALAELFQPRKMGGGE